jgi:hypothetical protein
MEIFKLLPNLSTSCWKGIEIYYDTLMKTISVFHCGKWIVSKGKNIWTTNWSWKWDNNMNRTFELQLVEYDKSYCWLLVSVTRNVHTILIDTSLEWSQEKTPQRNYVAIQVDVKSSNQVRRITFGYINNKSLTHVCLTMWDGYSHEENAWHKCKHK